jgi:hypothetical protein
MIPSKPQQRETRKTGARGRYGAGMPPDFAEIAPSLTRKALMSHYRVQHRAISRWLVEAGIRRVGQHITTNPVPGDYATSAPTMTKTEIMAQYGVSHNVVDRWARETGVHPYKRPVRPKVEAPKTGKVSKMGVGRRFVPSQPLSGSEEEAAHYLRRRYPAVYHCDQEGRANPKGKLWLCGARVLTGAELIAKAKDNGWDPDAWKRIAA